MLSDRSSFSSVTGSSRGMVASPGTACTLVAPPRDASAPPPPAFTNTRAVTAPLLSPTCRSTGVCCRLRNCCFLTGRYVRGAPLSGARGCNERPSRPAPPLLLTVGAATAARLPQRGTSPATAAHRGRCHRRCSLPVGWLRATLLRGGAAAP